MVPQYFCMMFAILPLTWHSVDRLQKQRLHLKEISLLRPEIRAPKGNNYRAARQLPYK